MSERMEDDLMDDLAYDEAEGMADMGDEDFGEFDELDAAEEDYMGDEEAWDGAEEEFSEDFEADEFDEFDEFEDYGDEAGDYGDEGYEDAMAFALGAEDTDEFFRRLRRIARGAVRVVRRAAPVVGRIARRVAPIASRLGSIASVIPHPYARIAGTALRGAQPILNLLGQLRAEGANEEEAMDAFAELASYDEAVRPIVAGLAARTILRNRGARLPVQTRRIIIRSMANAARTLTRRRGPAAIRALPRIVRSVRRTAITRRTPVRAIPNVVRRTAANVVRSGNLVRRLSRPVPRAVRRVRRITIRSTGSPRSFTLRGPVRITIASV